MQIAPGSRGHSNLWNPLYRLDEALHDLANAIFDVRERGLVDRQALVLDVELELEQRGPRPQQVVSCGVDLIHRLVLFQKVHVLLHASQHQAVQLVRLQDRDGAVVRLRIPVDADGNNPPEDIPVLGQPTRVEQAAHVLAAAHLKLLKVVDGEGELIQEVRARHVDQEPVLEVHVPDVGQLNCVPGQGLQGPGDPLPGLVHILVPLVGQLAPHHLPFPRPLQVLQVRQGHLEGLDEEPLPLYLVLHHVVHDRLFRTVLVVPVDVFQALPDEVVVVFLGHVPGRRGRDQAKNHRLPEILVGSEVLLPDAVLDVEVVLHDGLANELPLVTRELALREGHLIVVLRLQDRVRGLGAQVVAPLCLLLPIGRDLDLLKELSRRKLGLWRELRPDPVRGRVVEQVIDVPKAHVLGEQGLLVQERRQAVADALQQVCQNLLLVLNVLGWVVMVSVRLRLQGLQVEDELLGGLVLHLGERVVLHIASLPMGANPEENSSVAGVGTEIGRARCLLAGLDATQAGISPEGGPKSGGFGAPQARNRGLTLSARQGLPRAPGSRSKASVSPSHQSQGKELQLPISVVILRLPSVFASPPRTPMRGHTFPAR